MLEKHLNTLIRRAFQIAKIKSGDVDLNENELNDARYSLNTMLKSWDNRGFHIWKEKTANLILNKNQDKYYLPEDFCFENVYQSKIVEINKVGQYFLPVNTEDLKPGMDVILPNEEENNKIEQILENEIRLKKEIYKTFEKNDIVFFGIDVKKTINTNEITEETKTIELDVEASRNDTIFLLDNKNNWLERKVLNKLDNIITLDKEINNISADSEVFISPIIYKRKIEKSLEIEFKGVKIENKTGFKEDSMIIYFNEENERVFNKILVIDNDNFILEKSIDVDIEEQETEEEESVEIDSIECDYRVAAFDTPIKKPDTISNAYLYSFVDDSKLNINIISRREFNNLPKSDMSDPTQAYYEKKSELGTINIWNKPNSNNLYLQIDYIESLDALESSREIPDIPDEFIDAVIYNLAYKLGIEYGVPTDDLTILKAEADDVLNIAEMHDNEDCSIYIQPGR